MRVLELSHLTKHPCRYKKTTLPWFRLNMSLTLTMAVSFGAQMTLHSWPCFSPSQHLTLPCSSSLSKEPVSCGTQTLKWALVAGNMTQNVIGKYLLQWKQMPRPLLWRYYWGAGPLNGICQLNSKTNLVSSSRILDCDSGESQRLQIPIICLNETIKMASS